MVCKCLYIVVSYRDSIDSGKYCVASGRELCGVFIWTCSSLFMAFLEGF